MNVTPGSAIIAARAAAIGVLLVIAVGLRPATAQFICSGSADGNAPVSGNSSTVAGPNATSCNTGSTAGSGANGFGATAMGNAASATGDLTTAFGSNARAQAIGATAHGYAAQAQGQFSSAFGGGNQTAGFFGARATGDQSSAFGTNSVASGTNSTAIGYSSSAGFANSTAIGTGATATRANQQVFGTSSNTYTMAGVASSASRSAQSGPTQFVTSDAGGNLATASAAELGLATTADLAAINRRIDDVNREARGGIALALAASSLQYDTRPGKLSLAAGVGNFKGQSGFATGLGYAHSTILRFNAAFTAAQAGDVGVSVGASWTLN
jgi:trimeric autotransporter adhesin